MLLLLTSNYCCGVSQLCRWCEPTNSTSQQLVRNVQILAQSLNCAYIVLHESLPSDP